MIQQTTGAQCSNLHQIYYILPLAKVQYIEPVRFTLAQVHNSVTISHRRVSEVRWFPASTPGAPLEQQLFVVPVQQLQQQYPDQQHDQIQQQQDQLLRDFHHQQQQQQLGVQHEEQLVHIQKQQGKVQHQANLLQELHNHQQ